MPIKVVPPAPSDRALRFPSEEEFQRADPARRLDWARMKSWAAIIFDDKNALLKWRKEIVRAKADLATEKLFAAQSKSELKAYEGTTATPRR